MSQLTSKLSLFVNFNRPTWEIVYTLGYPLFVVWMLLMVASKPKNPVLSWVIRLVLITKVWLFFSSDLQSGFCWSIIAGRWSGALQAIYGPQNPLVLYEVLPWLVQVPTDSVCLYKVLDSYLHVDRCGLPFAEVITFRQYLEGHRLSFSYPAQPAGALIPLIMGLSYYLSVMVLKISFFGAKGTTLGLALKAFDLFVNFIFFFAGPIGPAWLYVYYKNWISGGFDVSRLAASFLTWVFLKSPYSIIGLIDILGTVGLFRFIARLFVVSSFFFILSANYLFCCYFVSLALTAGYMLVLMLLPFMIAVFIMLCLNAPDALLYLMTGSDFSLVTTFMPGLIGRFIHAFGRCILVGDKAIKVFGQTIYLCLTATSKILSYTLRAWASVFEVNYFTEGLTPGFMSVRLCLIVEAAFITLAPFNLISIVIWSVSFTSFLIFGFFAVTTPLMVALGVNVPATTVGKVGFAFVWSTIDACYNYFMGLLIVIEERWAKKLGTRASADLTTSFVIVRFFIIVLLPFFLFGLIFVRFLQFVRVTGKYILTLPFRIAAFFCLTVVILALPDAPFAFIESVFEVVRGQVVAALKNKDSALWMMVAWFAMSPLGVMLGIDTVAFRKELARQTLGTEDDEASNDPRNPVPSRLATLYTQKLVTLTRKTLLRVLNRLDQFKLPEFISKQYATTQVEQLRTTYQVLNDVGIPVVQGFMDTIAPEADPTGNPYLMEFMNLKGKILAMTNYKLGFSTPELGQHPWVQWLDGKFTEAFPAFISSASFTGAFEEVKSTLRYYSNDGVPNPELGTTGFKDIIDGAWKGVSSQFKDSKLTSIKRIFDQWYSNKKYSFGFGVGHTKKQGRVTQASREQVVSAVGGKKKFIQFMEELFYLGTNLTMPANVFTKEETLKPSKAESRSVRTVVGIAFTHYVRQLVTNFYPDHNYHPWDTPGKVGMSINGVNFDRLARVVSRHEEVFAGDMTAFDSSQIDLVLRLVAAIRKKGYDTSKDYDKICELIDITYEALLNQPLGFKNIGLILKKEQGFTTGHGSTSGDNTLALLVNYLYAWRKVTGLRAREFYHYNSLINLGDDHILGWDRVFGWSPAAAIEAMKDLGTTMRDEAPGLRFIPFPYMPVPKEVPEGDWRRSDLKFLSKVWLPKSGIFLEELEAAGITHISFPSCHDPRRLVGKLTGFQRTRKIGDTFKSYNTGLQYLALTSHHPDLYNSLARALQQHKDQHLEGWMKHGITPRQVKSIPSYHKVIRDWYSDSGKFDLDFEHEKAEDDDTPSLVLLTHDDAMAVVVRWIADFPTLLSPRYLNSRWADWLQTKLPLRMSWPLTLVGLANGASLDIQSIGWHLARTPYAFLRNPALTSMAEPYGVVIVRHWIAMALFRFVQRGRSFSVFDYVRFIDNFISNLTFLLTGSLSTSVIELDLHILESAIVIALSFVSFDIGLKAPEFRVPTASLMFGRILSGVLRTLFPSGSVDFQPFDALALRMAHKKGMSCLVSAPTGTSKSTRMMERLASVTKLRVVVIQPRHIVCVGVGTYMQSLFPNSGIGIQTEGHQASPDDRLVYTTAQSFLLSAELKSRPIVVLDEAHIDEPAYNVLRAALPKLGASVMYLTATPPKGLDVVEKLEVPAVNSFEVTTIQRTVQKYSDYESFARKYILAKSYSEKVLIFAPTLSSGAKIGVGIAGVCYLNSKQTLVDETANVYISTSVADAGLTVPDVETVISPDFDIQVSDPMDKVSAFAEAVRKSDPHLPYETPNKKHSVVRYFTLPDTTFKQRRGRTGRTVDGVFFYIHVATQKVEPKEYTFLDYMNGCAPAHRQAYPYFPADIKKQADPDMKKAPVLWDYGGSVTMHRFASLHYYWQRGVADMLHPKTGPKLAFPTFTAFLKANEDWIRYRVPDTFDPTDGEFMLTKKSSVVPIDEITTPDIDPEVPETRTEQDGVWARQDVPGRGLLCGVHTCRGVIKTVHGFTPPFNVIHEMLRVITNEDPNHDGLRDVNSFYDWATLVHVIYGHYHIRVRLSRNGRLWPLPEDIMMAEGPIVTVFLDGIHYNYFGVPYDEAASDMEADRDYRLEHPVNPHYAVYN